MKQAPDGKHLYTLEDIAKKVNQKLAKRAVKKLTANALYRWTIKINEDGTT